MKTCPSFLAVLFAAILGVSQAGYLRRELGSNTCIAVRCAECPIGEAPALTGQDCCRCKTIPSPPGQDCSAVGCLALACVAGEEAFTPEGQCCPQCRPAKRRELGKDCSTIQCIAVSCDAGEEVFIPPVQCSFADPPFNSIILTVTVSSPLDLYWISTQWNDNSSIAKSAIAHDKIS